MSVSKVVAVAGGFMALLASAGASSAAAEPCVLGTVYPVTSVASSSRPVETGGYGGTVNPLLRGADIRVAAQPGLTAEWLERRLEAQVAAGECQFGADQVFVEVVPVSEELVVRVTSSYEGPGVARFPDSKPDRQAASEILRRARELPTK
jgi:hypothetical protein